MPTRRRPLLARSVGLAAAGALLLAGCASKTDPEESAGSSSSSSSAAPTSATSSAPATGTAATTPFPADTEPDVAEPADAVGLTVTAARAAAQEGHDRVVFELAGTGTPGWTVEYVDTPSAQGSGEAVDVPGQAYLQVTLQGTSYPYETGATELARGPVAASGTSAVQGVFYDATFEGTSVAWIGTADRRPFRVYALTGPSRVVVEVSTAG